MKFTPLYKIILLEVIIPVLGDGCWVLSLYKTILFEVIILCMLIDLILLTIYAFKRRTLTIPSEQFQGSSLSRHQRVYSFLNHH